MRALKIILLIVVIAALLAIGYGWQQRTGLAEAQIRAYLIKQNIPVQSLKVTAVSTTHISLTDILLGERDTLKAATAELDFAYDWHDQRFNSMKGVMTGVEMRTKEGRNELILAPLRLEAQGQEDAERISVKGMFYNETRSIEGDFDGSYARNTELGTLHWRTKPMSFATDGFTFAELSPAFAGDFTTFPAKVSVQGTVDMKPGDWSVTPRIMIHELPLEALLRDVLGEGTTIKGIIKGDVPIRITKSGSWRIEPSDLANIGQVHIAMQPGAAEAAAINAHPQAETVKAALGNFQVDTMTLKVASTDSKGGIKMDWHFIGRNPDYLGGKSVDLTLAVTANLRDMWRSAEEVKRLRREAEKELLKQ